MKRMWRLNSTADGNALDLRFGNGVHTLGSGNDSDLRVSHPTVSRRHARILKREGTVVVEDLGSINGTFINGKRLAPYLPEALHDGDQLQLGKLLIEVELS